MSVPNRDSMDEELSLEIEENNDVEMYNSSETPLSVNTAEVPEIHETDEEFSDQAMHEADPLQYARDSQVLATTLASMNRKVDIVPAEDLDDDPNDIYKPEGIIHLDIDSFTDFCRLPGENQQRLSKPVYVRGLPWKILAIPRDSQPRTVHARSHRALGFFLQCNGESDTAAWNCVASAVLKVISQKEGIEDHSRKISHTFYPKENDWGYSQFLTCDQLANPEGGYIKNDTVKLVVHVCADAPHGVSWDSKKHAGYIGLKNQGATCYMNSILQTMFFTNKLRKAVYAMPTIDDESENNVALAMQRVFYDLQHSDRPVGTKKLTKSFGWDSLETFMQHDVQELCRVLLDNLENKMKGTDMEDTIPNLFKGKMKSYIKCTEIDYESSREESYYDIQLNMKNKNDLVESFREYTKPEQMDGDNKYDAGEFGLQPAAKGIKFVNFPPVLHLQLMRFQYDGHIDAMVKVNDRFEFPDVLNLNEFLVQAVEGEDYTYRLHAVLVHTGDFHGGHYVVFINTNLTGPETKNKPKWCKFDDDVVSRASQRDSISANFGGDDGDSPNKAFTSAYMLVYVRQSLINDVLVPVTDEDIPKHLRSKFEKERAEESRRKKEKSEAHLYTEVVFVTESDLQRHHGFDLVDNRAIEEDLPRERVEKELTINDLYDKACKLLCTKANQLSMGDVNSINVNKIRLWRFEDNPYRDDPQLNNRLPRIRPGQYLPFKDGVDDRTLEIEGERERERQSHVQQHKDDRDPGAKHIFYIEGPDDYLVPYEERSDMLFFLKYFDAKTEMLNTLGHIVLNCRMPLEYYMKKCREMAGLPENTPLRFYEEATPERIRPVQHYTQSLGNENILLEVNDGVILIFENANETNDTFNAKVLLDRIYNNIEVEIIMNGDSFLSVATDPEAPVYGQVGLDWYCNELAAFIGKAIDYDPAMILLWRTQPYHDRPTNYLNSDAYASVRVKDLLNLAGVNAHDPRRCKRYRLFYTKMPIRIAELERRKQMKVQIMDEKMNIQEITIFPDKTGTVANILEEARREFKLSPNGSGKLRLVYVGQNIHAMRVYQIFAENASVMEIAQKQYMPAYMVLRVEEIPNDQLVINSNEYLLPVAHFDRDPARMFGVPFYIKVRNQEPLDSVKKRLQEMLDVPVKEFEKFKFALVVSNRIVRYLDMETGTAVNLAELSQTHVTTAATHPYLGLDHMNKSRGLRSSHTTEKAIVIHN